ncbi:MAG: peroxidase family protein [Gemmataceae bacterium]
MKKAKTRTLIHLEHLEDRVVPSTNHQILAIPKSVLTDPQSIDGTGNNLANPEWGSTDTQLIRLVDSDYGDGVSTLAGEDRPSAREISNLLAAQEESMLNDRYLSDILWQWGQFIDHDLDLTEGADPAEPANIAVPMGDPDFDPGNSGTQEISFSRSIYDQTTGTDEVYPREQINEITAFIDGSMIYGSDEERADELRTFEGGKLKTSDGELLPYNEAGLENAGGTSDSLFLAGDVRANEQAGLIAMHTLWVREHNWWADQIAEENPDWSDEEIYQATRAIVIAEIQSITYNEFLPALLGPEALSDYEGYDPIVDPGIANIFSTASYRFGHSMLSTELLRLDNDGNVIDAGNLDLQDAFFNPAAIEENGIGSLLKGLASQQAQEIDNQIVDDVRNFLFGPPGAGGFDLASLNIQRGRDHGLPNYNDARIQLGLERVTSFDQISSDLDVQAALEEAYGTVDNIDVWVGALAEDHAEGSSMGELNQTVIVDQFERLRDGDRYWYQNVFEGDMLDQLENTTLADVIMRNTEITNLQANVFYTEEVLYYSVDEGVRSSDLAVVVNADSEDIVDRRSRDVVASGSLDQIEKVIVTGADSSEDRITIDVRQAQASLPSGIQVDAGDRRDSIFVRGTSGEDTFRARDNELGVNGHEITYSEVERVTIEASREDDVRIAPETDADVDVVQSGRDRNRRGRQGPGRSQAGNDNPWTTMPPQEESENQHCTGPQQSEEEELPSPGSQEPGQQTPPQQPAFLQGPQPPLTPQPNPSPQNQLDGDPFQGLGKPGPRR